MTHFSGEVGADKNPGLHHQRMNTLGFTFFLVLAMFNIFSQRPGMVWHLLGVNFSDGHGKFLWNILYSPFQVENGSSWR